jgi:hypothetical protein
MLFDHYEQCNATISRVGEKSRAIYWQKENIRIDI